MGVYPEATISRSFEIKAFKSGAARMAIEADVPIVPHIIWGAQRIWTKGHPRNMRRPKVPIFIHVGEPIYPTLPAAELTALLHDFIALDKEPFLCLFLQPFRQTFPPRGRMSVRSPS